VERPRSCAPLFLNQAPCLQVEHLPTCPPPLLRCWPPCATPWPRSCAPPPRSSRSVPRPRLHRGSSPQGKRGLQAPPRGRKRGRPSARCAVVAFVVVVVVVVVALLFSGEGRRFLVCLFVLSWAAGPPAQCMIRQLVAYTQAIFCAHMHTHSHTHTYTHTHTRAGVGQQVERPGMAE